MQQQEDGVNPVLFVYNWSSFADEGLASDRGCSVEVRSTIWKTPSSSQVGQDLLDPTSFCRGWSGIRLPW